MISIQQKLLKDLPSESSSSFTQTAVTDASGLLLTIASFVALFFADSLILGYISRCSSSNLAFVQKILVEVNYAVFLVACVCLFSLETVRMLMFSLAAYYAVNFSSVSKDGSDPHWSFLSSFFSSSKGLVEDWTENSLYFSFQQGDVSPAIFTTKYGVVKEVFDLQDFSIKSAEAKRSQKYGACVTIFTPSQLRDCGARLFVTQNGGCFAAVTRDGELINVVRHRQNSTSDDVLAIMTVMVQQGARYLECMDTVIAPLYVKCGFVPVAAAKWNNKYMPFDWDKQLFKKHNNGEPNYLYMVFNGDLQDPILKTKPVYNRDEVPVHTSDVCDKMQVELIEKLHNYEAKKIAGADELELRWVKQQRKFLAFMHA